MWKRNTEEEYRWKAKYRAEANGGSCSAVEQNNIENTEKEASGNTMEGVK